ncbi:MAG: phosphomannomutase/phosphoglucomutase, partial [Gammaproteobacteria bacterium]
MMRLSDTIFRAYDIRGIAGQDLTDEAAFLIGRAIGAEAREQGEKAIAVGRDGRLSSPALSQALADGLVQAGLEVYDIGLVPTPV